MALTDAQRYTIERELTKYPELATASARIIAAKLNTPGTAINETYVVSKTPQYYEHGTWLKLVSETSRNKFALVLDHLPGLKLSLNLVKVLDFTDPNVRSLINNMEVQKVMTAKEAEKLRKLGEEKASRAYEILGRDITVSEVQEVLNG